MSEIQFPSESEAQWQFAQWFVDELGGEGYKLWDGCVSYLDDGFQWSMIKLIDGRFGGNGWNAGTAILEIGDWLVIGENVWSVRTHA